MFVSFSYRDTSLARLAIRLIFGCFLGAQSHEIFKRTYNTNHGPGGQFLNILAISIDKASCIVELRVYPFVNDILPKVSRPVSCDEGYVMPQPSRRNSGTILISFASLSSYTNGIAHTQSNSLKILRFPSISRPTTPTTTTSPRRRRQDEVEHLLPCQRQPEAH
jgi:hypothetical protein